MGTVIDWPGGRKVAALVTVALELWSPGHWPAYAPMAAAWPLPGVDDTHSTSWVDYGVTTGIWRLLDILGDLPATVGVNGLVAERHPDTVAAVHDAGHEIAAHSWAQDVVPALLDVDTERDNIRRCTDVLKRVTGVHPTGWMSPRATGSKHTCDLLTEARLPLDRRSQRPRSPAGPDHWPRPPGLPHARRPLRCPQRGGRPERLPRPASRAPGAAARRPRPRPLPLHRPRPRRRPTAPRGHDRPDPRPDPCVRRRLGRHPRPGG
ncbi:polysaccharide deacetylase family protein [Streptomyces lasalocidi]